MKPAGRLRLQSEANHATASGFDHSIAVLVVVIAGTVPLGLLSQVLNQQGWRGCAWLLLCWLAIVPAVAPLRFDIHISAASIAVRRSWLGIPYWFRRFHGTTLERPHIWIMGTGDWGEDGGWPAARYCEIDEMKLGTPANAEELCAFLVRERQRLCHPAQAS